MNSTFNTALKQSSSLRRDLDSLSSSFSPQTTSTSPTSPSPPPPHQTAALQGQISTSLTLLSRTLDTYAQQARSEPSPEKAAKAHERLKNFRDDLREYRERFEELKREGQGIGYTQARTELLGRRGYVQQGGGSGAENGYGAARAETPENPYAGQTPNSNNPLFAGKDPSGGMSFGGPTTSQYRTQEDHALREQSFLDQTSSTLDEYLERGRAVLGDLGQQREMLKGTQRRLYTVGTTLGVSGDTIRMVERRARQDKWVFGGGVLAFVVFCWVVVHYLR